jgi:hypothetical protein
MAIDPMTGSTIVEYPDVESERGVLMVLAEFSTWLSEQETITSASAVSFQELIHKSIYAISGEVVSNLSLDSETMEDAQASVRAAYSVDSLLPDVGELGSKAENVDILHALVENALLYIGMNPEQFEYADDE